jgi:hypothetical protein
MTPVLDQLVANLSLTVADAIRAAAPNTTWSEALASYVVSNRVDGWVNPMANLMLMCAQVAQHTARVHGPLMEIGVHVGKVKSPGHYPPLPFRRGRDATR